MACVKRFTYFLGFTFHAYMNIVNCGNSPYKGCISSHKYVPQESQGFAVACFQSKIRYLLFVSWTVWISQLKGSFPILPYYLQNMIMIEKN